MTEWRQDLHFKSSGAALFHALAKQPFSHLHECPVIRRRRSCHHRAGSWVAGYNNLNAGMPNFSLLQHNIGILHGRDGKLEMNGLGGPYKWAWRFLGVESLTFYRMLPRMGPFDTTRWEYPFPDPSWETEIAEFIAATREGRRPVGAAAEALASMSIIEHVYHEEALR